MHSIDSPKIKTNATNYSYLEERYHTCKSQTASMPVLNQSAVQDVDDLLQQDNGRIILSHSSISSQFDQLHQDLKAKFEHILAFDLQDIEVYGKIKEWSCKGDEQSILLLVSVFALRYEKYGPALIALIHKTHHKSNAKILIYCDTTQSAQILSLAEKVNGDFLLVQYSIPRPFEILTANILEGLKKFLVEQSKQANKFDVVLFHPKNETFIKEISLMLRTEGITATTQIITEPGKSLEENLSNVIIVNNTQTLLQWNYDLSSVYLVLDSRRESRLYFNYSYVCFVEDQAIVDEAESLRRMSLISSRVGQYIMEKEQADSNELQGPVSLTYTDIYCLGMAYYGFLSEIVEPTKNITCCIQTLKSNNIIGNEGSAAKLNDVRIYEMALKGINPIFAQILFECKEKETYASYFPLLYAILTKPNLRPPNQQYRPVGIWRQSGYLHSCLDLIVKVKAMQEMQDSNIQEPDDEESYFSLKSLSQKYVFSIPAYETILEESKKIEQIFGIQTLKAEEALKQEQLNQILEILLIHLRGSVAFNSGSRRLGYFQKGKQAGILPHRECLMRLLNQRPSFILMTRLIEKEGQLVISTCNYIEDEVIISAYGMLPVTSKQSFGECEIDFYNITGAIFAHLSKYNSLQLENFERQHECSVELNQHIGTISVQCSKLREKLVRETFEQLINDIKVTYQKEARIVRHSNTLKVIIGSGGQIKRLTVKEGNEEDLIQDTCVVRNLDPEVQLADLKDLFDQFVQTKEIQVHNNRLQNEATVKLYSDDDYKTFVSYFQNCVYLGRPMIINPYKPKSIQVVLPQKYLLFEWNHWKSKKEANILMESEVGAKQVFKVLTELGYTVQQKQEQVCVSGLKSITDQRDIELMILGCGKAKEIEIMRYYGQKNEEDYIIERMINESFKGDEIKYTAEPAFKGKNGYRSKKVKFEKDDVMKEAYFLMNDIVGRIGTGKLYATPTFTYPVKLPNDDSYIPVYEDIVREVAEDMNRARPIETEIFNERDNKYLILKANEDAEVDIIVNFLSDKLQGEFLNIKIENPSLLFTEMATKKIKSLEKKFVCKFTFEFLQKKIKVLTRSKNINFIEKEINTKLVEEFVCVIPVYINSFRHIQKNIEEIKKIHSGLSKVKIEFEAIAKTLILTGPIELIEKARNELEKLVKSLRKKSASIEDLEDYCALCCEEYTHPFKLQSCGHKFCFDCLQSTIQITLKDLSLYPIKCPECLQKILVSDLNCLCTEKDWKEVTKMSVNHFVYTHPGEYTFCYTVSCPQINIIEGNWFRCRQCKKGYCLNCKGNYHPGMSCEENRYGSDRMFKEYMNQIGGRVCANKICKAPIVRISGCFKVQCSRCKKCMCFKCPENAMVAYNTPQEAYDHLDKKHGGCF